MVKSNLIHYYSLSLISFELIPPQLADINLVICKSSTMFCKLAPIFSYFLHVCCIESLSMCVHNHILFICNYCVPMAVYHHEPSRRTLIELGIKIKLLIATTTQSHSMHVCAIIVYVSCYL